MKINTTAPQLSPAAVHPDQSNTTPVLGAVNRLAHAITSTQPNLLALTHQFADVRIDLLTQRADLFFRRMSNDLESSSSNSKAVVSAETNAERMGNRPMGLEIHGIENEINALTQLKQRDFKPLRSEALTIPLSGKGLGGAGSSAAAIRELETEVKIAEEQVSVFRDTYIPKTLIKLDNAVGSVQIRKYQTRLSGLRRDLRKAEVNLVRCRANLRYAQGGASGSR